MASGRSGAFAAPGTFGTFGEDARRRATRRGMSTAHAIALAKENSTKSLPSSAALPASFRTSPIAADGDCFFSAVTHALQRSDSGTRSLITRNALLNSGIDARVVDAMTWEMEWSGRFLRTLVAECVTRSSPRLDDILRFSASLLTMESKEGAVSDDVRHMQQLPGSPLSRAWRGALKRRVSNRHMYWADTFAIAAVEQLLNVRVLAVEDLGRKFIMSYGVEHGSEWAPDRFVTVFKSGQHYSALAVGGASCFTMAEIPPALRQLACDSHLTSSHLEYISLQTQDGDEEGESKATTA